MGEFDHLVKFDDEEDAGPSALGTAARSFAFSLGPGLLGVEPSQELRRAQGEFPISTLLGELSGFAVPYVGWAKAAKGIGFVQKGIKRYASAEKIKSSPFKGTFTKSAITFAPFELARIGTAYTLGEDIAEATGGEFTGTTDVALSAGLDLALIGGIDGAIKLIGTAGKRGFAQSGRVTPGAELDKPLQIQARQLQKNITDGKVKDTAQAEARLNQINHAIRSQKPSKGSKYVGELEGLDKSEDFTRTINRMFTPNVGKNFEKKFIFGGDGKTFLKDKFEAQKVLVDTGLVGKENLVQFPRVNRYIGGKKGAKKAVRDNDKRIIKALKPLDSTNGLYFRRDKVDGLFVMAKKYNNSDWVFFKTDSPGSFAPNAAKFASKQLDQAGKFQDVVSKGIPLSDDPNAATAVHDALTKFRRDVAILDTRGLKGTEASKRSIAGLTKTFMDKAGLGNLADNELKRSIEQGVRGTIAPAAFQFRNNPIAAHIFAAAKLGKDTAEAAAERLFLGGRVAKGEGNLFSVLASGARPAESKGSILNLLEATFDDAAELAAFQRTTIAGVSPEEGVKLYGLGPKGLTLMRKLNEVDEFVQGGINKVQKALKEKVTVPKQHHYMISRFWTGDQRVEVLEGNKIIGYASGKQRGTAIREAEDIVKEAAANGKEYSVGRSFLSGELDRDLNLLSGISKEDARNFGFIRERLLLSKTAPKTLTEQRKGARFFSGDRDIWKRQDIEKQVFNHLRNLQLYQAKTTHASLYAKDITRLGDTGETSVALQLTSRIRDVFGEQGKISRVLNEGTDKILGSVLGKNSATKVVGAMNSALFRLTFGFANTSFNIANLLTFSQTAFPHISMLTSAAPETLAKMYTYYPVSGAKTVNGIGVLDMMKLTGRSFAQMARPGPGLRKHIERSLAEGVTDPKFVEAYVGEKSLKSIRFKEVLSGKEPFSGLLGAAADFVPSVTEKWARGHAFVMGRTFFKDVMGITDDEMLYQMTKQFVEQTQFLYSTADRAKIITGPLGSSFGLFKNWVMNYIGWMGTYAGEGINRNNWAPLLWAIGGTTTVGGIGALPFYRSVDDFSQWLGNDSILQNTYEMFNEEPGKPSRVADGVFYGLPGFLGFSIQNQVAAPFRDPGQDAARLMSFVYADRMNFARKAFGSAIDNWNTTGENPIKNSQTRDLFMRAFAPKSIYRAQQALQDSTLKSLSSGLPVTNLSLGERVTWGLASNPLQAERAYQVANELWEDRDKMRKAVSNLGQEWADAIDQKDWRGVSNIIQRAILGGVDISSVIKSGKSRLAHGQEDMIDRQFTPEAIFGMKQAGLVD